MSKAKTITTWILISILTAAFIAAGSTKLMGVEMMHHSFAIMGLPVWFGYLSKQVR